MTDNTPIALEPCPFCNVAMNADADAGTFGHPDSESECILAKHAWALLPKYTAMWNTRTRTPSHSDLVEALRDVGASLAAAISLLERGGKAAKKAAPSDRMFDQMVKDYKASLNRTRAILTKAEAGR